MTNNPRFVMDGATTLLGGVDEGREPLLLKGDQVSRAINVTMRGGFPRTRPPFYKRGLVFESGEVADWYFNNKFQGYSYYDDFQGMEKLVVSIGGRIFLIDPHHGFMVTDITPRKTTTTTANFTTSDPLTNVAVTVSNTDTIFAGYPLYINGKEYQLVSKTGLTLTVRTMEEATGTLVTSGAMVEFLDPNSPSLPLAWFEQAEQYLCIQNGQASCIIYDGASTRRAIRGTEIPSGTVMAYGRGRMWVAVNDGREFVAGDIAGGPTGVLGFTENNYLNGGGAFRIGANVGRIRSMKFVMNLDTSLGQGPLQVLCDRAIYSVNAPTSREQWAVVTDPIQTESLINFGAVGHYSTVLVNGDLFFRAEDGLRSFFIARRDFGMWGNTPVSKEVERTLASDTPELLIHSAGTVFDNRLLFTAVPTPGENGVRHKCLVALDFDLISTMGQKAPPAFDGFWTGIQPTGIVSGRFAGRNRCFVFTHNGEEQNELWELLTKGESDNGSSPIECRIEYRSMSFPRQGGISGLKRLEGAEVWVSKFAGEVDLTMTYKPDQHPCWQAWATKTICVTSDQCSEDDPCDSTTSLSNMKGFKTRLGFGIPSDSAGESDEKAQRFGYSFQPCLEWAGFAVISKLLIYAHEEEEWAIAPPSDDRDDCGVIQCCPPDPFGYVATCGQPDAPVALQFTTLSPFGEYYIQFPVEAGFTYQPYHRNAVLTSSLASFTPTTDSIYTFEITRIANIGALEAVWYTRAAAGDCPLLTSREMEISIVY